MSNRRLLPFDEVIPAAIEGTGVAMGVLPHLKQQLRDGVLCAPFGRGAIANRGTFFVVVRRDVAGRDAVKASWPGCGARWAPGRRTEARAARRGQSIAGEATKGAGRSHASTPPLCSVARIIKLEIT